MVVRTLQENLNGSCQLLRPMSETGIPSAAVHQSTFKGGDVEKGGGTLAAVS